MKQKKVTIRDVAKKAGVSYQTVSRVINNNESVAEDTRLRVQKVMDALGYRPNRVAQMLTTNRSNTLELFIVDVGYGGRLADSTKNMAHAAKEAGYSLLVSDVDSQGLQAAFENAAARLVDGVIMYAPRLRIEDEKLLELSSGIPLVRRDYVPESRLAWVGFDQAQATRLAVEHLLRLGHRDIAAVPPVSEIINGYWRYTTWHNVLLEHGLTPGPFYPGDYSMLSGYIAGQEIIKTQRPFTALVAGTDYMAVGCMRALREHGLRVPDDVSVVGYDNTEFASYIDPALTTIEFKFARQDKMAVQYLIDLIHDPDMELHQRVFTAELVVRESTALAPEHTTSSDGR
ncbi:MAG: LacI family transcriptional regulator [Anaerolineae bacterium]|nr:LacI family transcriptional regulator [Anaerolineae bacterium]